MHLCANCGVTRGRGAKRMSEFLPFTVHCFRCKGVFAELRPLDDATDEATDNSEKSNSHKEARTVNIFSALGSARYKARVFASCTSAKLPRSLRLHVNRTMLLRRAPFGSRHASRSSATPAFRNGRHPRDPYRYSHQHGSRILRYISTLAADSACGLALSALVYPDVAPPHPGTRTPQFSSFKSC
jgi:hypothetical protein